MIDPLSAVAIASAVAQFVSFGVQIATRLAEYSDTLPNDVPRPLQNINTQLPLLINAIERLQAEAEVDKYNVDTRCIIRGVVQGCYKLIQDIDTISLRLKPQPGESLKAKLKKVFGSLKDEERIQSIDRALQAYIQILILHQVVDRNEIPLRQAEDTNYFEVKEKLVDTYEPRPNLTGKLDKYFYKSIRSQTLQPQYVVLQGQEGVGKSQLALEYCYACNQLEQFRTIFWLDAATPEKLKQGLESAAAVVKRNRDGTRTEKLEFIDTFLTHRWHPWLLVLDNYNHKAFDGEDVIRMLPTEGYGAILITTRNIGLDFGPNVAVPRFLNYGELQDIKHKVTRAVENKELDPILSAIGKGFEVNQHDSNGWPFLNRAALMGFPEAVRLFLENGADPNFDRTKTSGLTWAAGEGYLDTMNLLLDHEDRKNVRLDQEQYVGALARAIQEGHPAAAELLMSRRHVKPDMSDRSLREGFTRSASDGHLDLLRFLVSLSAVPPSAEERTTAINRAIGNGYFSVVQFLISEAGFSPNAKGDYGYVPLYCAARFQNSEARGENKSPNLRDEMIGFLLQAGADPNLPGQDGSTPINEASLRGFTSTITLLLDAGADPTIEDNSGYSPLKSASKFKSPEAFPLLVKAQIKDEAKRRTYFQSALYYAARTGDRELALAVLPNVAIDEPEAFSGNTALGLAVRRSQGQVARFLIKKGGAKANAPDKEGRLPLFVAAENGLDGVVKDIVTKGGQATVDSKDDKEDTPLIVAVRKNQEKVVKVLMEAGADNDEMNQFGETALDVAEEKGNKRVMALLKGKDPDA